MRHICFFGGGGGEGRHPTGRQGKKKGGTNRPPNERKTHRRQRPFFTLLTLRSARNLPNNNKNVCNVVCMLGCFPLKPAIVFFIFFYQFHESLRSKVLLHPSYTLSSVSPFFSPDYYYIDETREAKKGGRTLFAYYILSPSAARRGKRGGVFIIFCTHLPFADRRSKKQFVRTAPPPPVPIMMRGE